MPSLSMRRHALLQCRVGHCPQLQLICKRGALCTQTALGGMYIFDTLVSQLVSKYHTVFEPNQLEYVSDFPCLMEVCARCYDNFLL